MSNKEEDGRKNRRWRNILLDRRFQLKYVGLVLVFSSAISLALGTFLVRQIRENSRMLQLDAEMDPVFQEQLAQSDAQAIMVLVLALLAFNVLVGLGTVVLTHRMVGPIFVLRRYLDTLANGGIPELRKLREGDEFTEAMEALHRAVTAVREEAEVDRDRLRNAAEALKTDDLATVKNEIETVMQGKERRLDIEGA